MEKQKTEQQKKEKKEKKQKIKSNGMSFPRNMWLLFLLVGAKLGRAATASDFSAKCQSFQPERLVKNSTRTRLEYVASGTTIQLDDNVPSCGRTSQVVDANICRVALQIPTSNRSSLSFELWLPERWDEKRYVATGNGGVDGCKFSFPGSCLVAGLERS